MPAEIDNPGQWSAETFVAKKIKGSNTYSHHELPGGARVAPTVAAKENKRIVEGDDEYEYFYMEPGGEVPTGMDGRKFGGDGKDDMFVNGVHPGGAKLDVESLKRWGSHGSSPSTPSFCSSSCCRWLAA